MLPEYARHQIKECLHHLADIAWQERVWVHGEGKESSSLPELISQLFDDTALDDCLDAHKIALSPKIDAHLRELGRMLTHVDQEADVAMTIKSPLWQQIVELAGHIEALVEN